MDLSAFIFVALAVAWAVYLVPKAIRHHDEVARSRSVDRFSHTMRVLAHREAVSGRDSRLVVSPGRTTPSSVVVTKSVTVETSGSVPAARGAAEGVRATPAAPRREVAPAVRRAAAARAAARRRRVLGVVLVALLVIVVVAAFNVISWAWTAVPGVVLVAWLVACRVMVRAETGLSATASLRRAERRDARAAQRDQRREKRIARRQDREEEFFGDYEPIGDLAPATADTSDSTEEIAAVVANARSSVQSVVESGVWDPVPMTLPTYVDKATASRTVRTIDLDSTGVWTSGRSQADSALAREAEQAERVQRAEADKAAEAGRRATGS